MTIPTKEFQWIASMVLVVILAACLFFYIGLLDQAQWSALVQGLVSMSINGAKQ